MRRTGLIAAAALIAAALPLTIATDTMAQSKVVPGGGGGAPRAAPAPAVPGGGGGIKSGGMVGGGVRGGPVGGGAIAGGGVKSGAVIGSGPRVGAGPRVGWSGPRHGWDGRRHHRHRRHFVSPGFGFGTGLLFGGAYAASPYYYDYYDEPYYDDYVLGGASPEEIAYCQRRYRSYDVRTRSFLGYDGRRHPCP